MKFKLRKVIIPLLVIASLLLLVMVARELTYGGKEMACRVVNSISQDNKQLNRIESGLNTALNTIYDDLALVGWFDRVSLHPIYEYVNREDFYIDAYASRFEITHLTAVASERAGNIAVLEKVGIWLNGSLIQFSVIERPGEAISIEPESIEIKCAMSDEVFGESL